MMASNEHHEYFRLERAHRVTGPGKDIKGPWERRTKRKKSPAVL